MSRTSLPAMDKEWQARNDADTLMRAKEIEANKSRLTAARKVAATEAKRFAQVATNARKQPAPAKK